MSFPADQCLVQVINLDRDTDRLERLSRRLKEFQLPWSRLRAIDGRTIDPDDERIVRYPPVTRWHSPLTAGEAACFLSHIAALERLVAADHEYGLVLEDDAVPLDGVSEVIAAAIEKDICGESPPWEVLRLERTDRRRARAVVGNLPCGRRLVDYSRQPSGTTAYLINRRGAQLLLAATPPVDRPVDIFLSYPYETGIRSLGVVPPLFSSGPDASSITAVEARRSHKKPSAWIRRFLRRRLFSTLRVLHRTKWNLGHFGLGGLLRIYLAALVGREAQGPRPAVRQP